MGLFNSRLLICLCCREKFPSTPSPSCPYCGELRESHIALTLGEKYMPTVVNLIKHGEQKPSSLAQVDDDLCKFLGVTPDPDICYAHWFDIIGFAIACGRTLDQLIERYTQGDEADTTYATIARWLKDNYTAEVYYQPKGW